MQKKGLSKIGAALAYDSITAAMEMNPLFVVALFLELSGDSKTADQFYAVSGA